MMENITYLLGAGASAQCLPIVSEMSKKVRELASEFEQNFNHAKLLSYEVNKEKGALLIRDLNWLANICDKEKNFSVDTFAKKLLLSNRIDDYERLKNILTLYFTLQQKFKEPDVRYDNFWASLLSENDKFPDNIKVLSWNYDFQLELTYQDFINSNSLTDASKKLNILTHKTIKDDSSINEFAVFKLNGSATYNSEVIQDGCNYVVDNIRICGMEDVVLRSIDYYTKSDKKNVVTLLTHLSYAWEHDKEGIFYKKMKDSLRKTTVLVVIGYSFPYFNREVDKLTLNKYMPNLKKVYFQDAFPDNIKERFAAINNNLAPSQLISIHDKYQFYLPNEL
jgi:hypothetical protein